MYVYVCMYVYICAYILTGMQVWRVLADIDIYVFIILWMYVCMYVFIYGYTYD